MSCHDSLPSTASSVGDAGSWGSVSSLPDDRKTHATAHTKAQVVPAHTSGPIISLQPDVEDAAIMSAKHSSHTPIGSTMAVFGRYLGTCGPDAAGFLFLAILR